MAGRLAAREASHLVVKDFPMLPPCRSADGIRGADRQRGLIPFQSHEGGGCSDALTRSLMLPRAKPSGVKTIPGRIVRIPVDFKGIDSVQTACKRPSAGGADAPQTSVGQPAQYAETCGPGP